MKEELFRNKLHIESPTSISLGYNTWYNLDTKLVGRVKKTIDENQQLQNRIDKAIEYMHNFDIFDKFSFPLMKKWEEQQVKSSIEYEFNNSLYKDLLEILKGKSE